MTTAGKTIVVLTGAGISKESGLETFRDKGGLWSKVSIEDVATPEAFERDPGRVHEFYNARRRQLLAPGIAPNPAHEALVRLETRWPGRVIVVTQNIDDLHDRAGQRGLLHMHGELLKIRCVRCRDVHRWIEDVTVETPCPACGDAGGLRPHVVWFGEQPFGLDEIAEALADCSLFVAIGTSGAVYPAAGFVHEAKQRAGARTLELNLEPSDGTDLFDEHRHGPAGEIVPAYVEELLSGVSSA